MVIWWKTKRGLTGIRIQHPFLLIVAAIGLIFSIYMHYAKG